MDPLTLDLAADLKLEKVTLRYGPGVEPDVIGPLCVVDTYIALRDIYDRGEQAKKSNAEVAEDLGKYLVALGCKHLPTRPWAPHAVAQHLMKLGYARKKKFETTLWADGELLPGLSDSTGP